MNSGYFKRIKLTFDEWELPEGKYLDSKDTIEAILGSFHSGTTFNADLYARKDELEDFEEQIKKGFRPKFIVITKSQEGTER